MEQNQRKPLRKHFDLNNERTSSLVTTNIQEEHADMQPKKENKQTTHEEVQQNNQKIIFQTINYFHFS